MFDARIALILRLHGVIEWATGNVFDFAGFGFTRRINPVDETDEGVPDD